MPFNPIGGPSGSVLVGGVPFAFGKWRASLKNALPRVNNFTSAFQQLVKGLTSATLNMEGPYDSGNMPLTVGNSYEFTLKYAPSISLTVNALVGEIGPSQDIEDAGRIAVTAESSGIFVASIS